MDNQAENINQDDSLDDNLELCEKCGRYFEECECGWEEDE